MFSIILGTKAELIKCMPVLKELDRRGLPYTFIHTGQHSISDLVEDFGLRPPDVVLYEPPRLSSRFMTKTHKALFWAIPLIFKIRAAVRRAAQKYVLYHGDTMTTAAAAIGSSKLLNPKRGWKNGHLEAGLRSGSLFEPFPEEISRRVADRFSDFLFSPSRGSAANVRKMKGKVFMTGNTIVDCVKICLGIARARRMSRPKERRYVMVNIHRHENIKSKKRMEEVVKTVEMIKWPVYWPMHDNTRKQLKKFGLWPRLQKKNIHISPLITYIRFLWWLAGAYFIITDGGSIQEESLTLRKPCVLMRERTERQEGLKTGINFLCGADAEKAWAAIKKIEGGIRIKKFKNPYGDGTAAKKIIAILMEDSKRAA